MKFENIIFVDLDSTLIQTRSGETFPQYNNDWILIDPVVNYINKLSKKGNFKVIIVSNQGGISRGRISETNFDNKLTKIISTLPFPIYRSFIAKSMNSVYRKPKVDSLLKDLEDSGVKPSSTSLMIGDAGGRSSDFSDSDLKFAINLGIKFIHANDINK